MQTSKTKGFIGVIGIWVTAGIALPLINILDNFSPPQLMVFRGFITAFLAFMLLKGSIGKVDTHTKLMVIVLPLATLGLFQGIRYLGAGPTIIIITATPVVNFLIGYFSKRTIRQASVVALVFILFGVTMAQWGGTLNLRGFLWAIFAMVMNGILYELFARAKSDAFQKCFYTSGGMGVVGLLISFQTPWPNVINEPALLFWIFAFAFIGGFLYWIANLWTFDNLPTNEASILAQGETPAVIIGAYFILGEQLTILQWIGVIVALCAAYALSQTLNKA